MTVKKLILIIISLLTILPVYFYFFPGAVRGNNPIQDYLFIGLVVGIFCCVMVIIFDKKRRKIIQELLFPLQIMCADLIAEYETDITHTPMINAMKKNQEINNATFYLAIKQEIAPNLSLIYKELMRQQKKEIFFSSLELLCYDTVLDTFAEDSQFMELFLLLDKSIGSARKRKRKEKHLKRK